jgi:hypothetical protein
MASAFCFCSHHTDRHDFDGKCVDCDCEEFSPSELFGAQESPQLED